MITVATGVLLAVMLLPFIPVLIRMGFWLSLIAGIAVLLGIWLGMPGEPVGVLPAPVLNEHLIST